MTQSSVVNFFLLDEKVDFLPGEIPSEKVFERHGGVPSVHVLLQFFVCDFSSRVLSEESSPGFLLEIRIKKQCAVEIEYDRFESFLPHMVK